MIVWYNDIMCVMCCVDVLITHTITEELKVVPTGEITNNSNVLYKNK